MAARRGRRRVRPRRRGSQLGSVSRIDFNAIAQAFCATKAPDSVINTVSDYLASRNPRFAKNLFARRARCDYSR